MSLTGNAEAAAIEWKARALMQVAQLTFAMYVADKQFDLAQQYSDRAQNIFDKQMELATSDNGRWASSGGPCLDGFLSEVCGAPVEVPNYLEEAAKTMGTVRYASAIAQKKIYECADVHCFGVTAHMANEMAHREAALATSAVHFAFRREEVDAERKNQLRLANKAQGISLSRNAYNGSSAGLGAISAQYAVMAQKAGDGLNSSLQQIGYSAQQLGQSLLNPFRSEPPVNNDPIYESQRENNSLLNRYPAPSAVDAVAPSISNGVGGSWGTNPMQGVRGASNSESPGTSTAAAWGDNQEF